MDHSEECMEMIANAGEAKTLALNALSLAGQGAFKEAEKVLQDSEDALNKAHAAHTKLLFCEAQEEDLKVTLLMIHAGDHLNSADTIKVLVEELRLIHGIYILLQFCSNTLNQFCSLCCFCNNIRNILYCSQSIFTLFIRLLCTGYDFF